MSKIPKPIIPEEPMLNRVPKAGGLTAFIEYFTRNYPGMEGNRVVLEFVYELYIEPLITAPRREAGGERVTEETVRLAQTAAAHAGMAVPFDIMRAALASSMPDAEPVAWREFLNFVRNAPVASGVCCCGDNMDKHADPMASGHSPVDQWDYSLSKWLDQFAAPHPGPETQAGVVKP